MPRRHSSDPRRHILPHGELTKEGQDRLIKYATYHGSPEHKRAPLDHDIVRPLLGNTHKTLCDLKRPITAREAQELFIKGIRMGMVSKKMVDGFPVRVWAVDEQGEVYEAKPGGLPHMYHGYPLGPRDGVFPELVRKEWKRRARP